MKLTNKFLNFCEKYFTAFFFTIAFFSRAILPIAIIFATYKFAYQTTLRPEGEVYSFILTAFGIALGLSATCFTMASNPTDTGRVRYAGEKLLHASVLLIQVLLAIFLKQYLFETSSEQRPLWIDFVASTVLSWAAVLISLAAGWCWNFGFDALLQQLWDNYQKRLDGTYDGEGPKHEILP